MPAERAADDPVDPTDLELRSRIPPNAHGTRLIDYLAARFRYHTVATWRAEIGTHARPAL